MLAAEAYCGRLRLPQWLCVWWAALGTVFLAFFVSWYCPLFGPTFWGFVFFLTIHYCVQREQVGRCPWRGPANCLAHVGLMSYSLYLVHSPVIGVVRQLLGPRSQTSDPCELLVNALLMAVLSYVVAKGFFIFVESRFIARKDDAAESSSQQHTVPRDNRPGLN
jgi:peptidoglycan/LPS O-acetylase OafA/YrhL